MKTAINGTKDRGAGRIFALFLGLMLALALGYATEAYAAPGDPDPGFDEDGKVATNFTEGFSESGLDVAVQEDGKVVVAGNIYRGSANGYDFALARYNPDGSLDTTFDGDGRVMTPVGAGGSFDDAYGVAVRPDGKIVAAGFTDNSGTTNNVDFAAVRYNPDGSLDASFGTEGKVITPVGGQADYAVDIAVQGTKTILAGRSYKLSHNDFALVRYDDNGDLDTTFDTDGKATLDFSSGSDDYGEDIAVEPGGDIVVAGSRGTAGDTPAYGSSYDFAIARFEDNGALDTSFNGGKVTTHFGSGHDSAYGVVVQEDGKIVVGGKASNGSREDYALARYNPNGSLDDGFDFDGKVTTDFGGAGGWLWDLALQDDGRIVAAGTSTAANTGANFALARYNPDGSLNSSFGHDGKIMTDFFGFSDDARSVAIGEDGRIVAAGVTSGSGSGLNFAVARYFGGSDAKPPRVRAPEQSLVAGSTLGATDVPVKLSWSATDADGEVTNYQLQQSTDSGAYEDVGLTSSATTTRTLQLAPGSNYRFRVRATDDNGNRSVWKYGPRFTLDALQENAPSIAYARIWKTQSLAGAYGGKLKYATARGAKATLSFTGTGVAWVAPESKTRGKAAVYLDGVKVATVDLFSNRPLARQVVFSKGNLDPARPHKLEVRNLGTSGRPRVDVDSFVVLR
jgi:uncharacterized delta-60 repeat protein